MSPNNNFNILAWYDSVDQQNHRKSYVYGKIWGLIAPNNDILPFQFVSPGSNGDVTKVIVRDPDGKQVYDITGQLNIEVLSYTDRDTDEPYDIVMYKGGDSLVYTLPEGRYYLELTQGSKTWYSEVFTAVSCANCYIKLEYWDNDNLYFKGGHIEYSTGFKFVCYICTQIGKPSYPFEEELTERDGYKFIEKQTSSKQYNMVFDAPEFICDALRLVRMCDNIQITDKGKVYRVLSFAVSVDWEDVGDIASVAAEFETDTVVTKIANVLNGPSESGQSFKDALLYEKNSPIMFGEGIVAQYQKTVQIVAEAQFTGKLIRELDEYLNEVLPDSACVAIDLGAGTAVKFPVKNLLSKGDSFWNFIETEDGGYLTPKSAKSVYVTGDIVCKSVEAEIEDAELPIASKTQLGLIKVGSGLSIAADGTLSAVNTGGGGLDIDELQQYLDANNYYNSSSALEGYVKADVYTPITSSDTILKAFGKLERHFDDYVTLATAQTITGAKIFTQDVISQGDIIAKSTSEAIADAELPIASKTQLGLIKVGSGFEIAADGTLNNTGGGGLTEVYWDDIKNPPTTLAGYGITDALSKTGTAAAASKLSPGCYLWGNKFTGENDIDKSITIRNAASLFFKDTAGNSKQFAFLDTDNNLIIAAGTATAGYPTYLGYGNGFYLRKYNSSSNRVVIMMANSDGDVGFGTDSPAENVHIKGGVLVDGKTLKCQLSGTTDSNYLYFINGDKNSKSRFLETNNILYWQYGLNSGSHSNYTHSIMITGINTVNLLEVQFYAKQVLASGDFIAKGDIIAKSTSAEISDAELPIASKTQLGLIKIGTGFDITADGTINNTGGGGLTEVYWDDIKGKPTTFAPSSHTHQVIKYTDSRDEDILPYSSEFQYGFWGPHIKTKGVDGLSDESAYHTSIYISRWRNKSGGHAHNLAFTDNDKIHFRGGTNEGWNAWKTVAFTTDNVASASRLSPGCKIWGQPLTGDSDVAGNLTGVGNIYFNTDSFYLSPAPNTSNWILAKVNNNTYIGGLGGNLYLGYRGTEYIEFYGGTTESGEIGSRLGRWTTTGLCVGGYSSQAKLHVIGDGLFTDTLSTSSVVPRSNNAYDLGSSSYRYRRLYLGNVNSSWIGGKTSASINIDSVVSSSTSTYFPIIRWKSYTGKVFNLGALQNTDDTTNTFGFYMFEGDRTSNGTDAGFYMKGDGNMYGSGSIIMSGDVIAKSTSTAISDAELPIASASTLGLIKVGSGLKITNGVLSATGGGVQGETGPQGQGVTYRWSGTSLQLGTIPAGGGTTTWGDPVNLKGQKGDTGATGPQGPKGDDGRDGTLSASTICYLPSAGTIFTTDNRLGVKLSGGNGIVGTNNGIRDNLYFNYISSAKYVLVDGSANLTCKGTIFYANLSQDSDLRLKNVLGELNGVLDIMSQIPVIEYQYKADEDKINYYGFGAQSFIGRFRNIATLNNDHYTINTSGIVAIAFQGVKELYALQKQTTNEIDVLKQRIALLEAENQNLWNIINEREAA